MFKNQVMIKLYYAIPEKYNTSSTEEKRQETEGMIDTILLPEYKIEIPNERLISYLEFEMKFLKVPESWFLYS
jgi:hypothetical protein